LPQPGERCLGISEHPFAPFQDDRLFGMRRGEDLHALALEADGALIERQLGARIGGTPAGGDRGGEAGMGAAPMIEPCRADLEEIGDFGFAGAKQAEFARLLGALRAPGIGGGRGGFGGACRARGIAEIPCFAGDNREFYFFLCWQARFRSGNIFFNQWFD
jgi:hypothetical protein